MTDSQRQSQGKRERGGLPEREREFGTVGALRYYFHLPFPELSELRRSELMWAEICLSLWPRTNTRARAGSCVLKPTHHPTFTAPNVHHSVALNDRGSALPRCSYLI